MGTRYAHLSLVLQAALNLFGVTMNSGSPDDRVILYFQLLELSSLHSIEVTFCGLFQPDSVE